MNDEQLFVKTAGCSGLYARFHRPDYITEANCHWPVFYSSLRPFELFLSSERSSFSQGLDVEIVMKILLTSTAWLAHIK